MIVTLGIFLISIFLLFFISNYLVSALIHFSRKAKLSTFFVGVIILSIGTTIPEFVDSVISSLQGVGELGFGTLLGSSVTNVCLVLGVAAIISPIRRLTRNETKEGFFVLLATLVFLGLTFVGSGLDMVDGLILISLFFVLQYIFRKKEVTHKGELVFNEIQVDLVLIPVLLLGVFTSGFVAVGSTVALTQELGISLTFFGLTVMSLSTSLPELASSIVSSFKKNSKMAVGNVLGSNLNNLLLIGGIMALINPVHVQIDDVFIFTAVFITVVSVLFILMTFFDRDVDKRDGLILLAFYLIFIFWLSLMSG